MKAKKALLVYLLSFSIFNVVSLIVLIVLVGVGTIGWNYITGFLIGALATGTGIWILLESVKILIKTENHYFYYFMYLVRIGCYFIPFVLAYFINDGNTFSYYAILIGLVPVITLPYFNAFVLKRAVFKKTGKEDPTK